MKTEYTKEDMERALAWYEAHKQHVDGMMVACDKCYPMSGSDISRPELWKPAAWNYFFGR